MRLCLPLVLLCFFLPVEPTSMRMKISLFKEILLMHPNVIVPSLKQLEDCCYGADYCLTKCLLNGHGSGHCSDGGSCGSSCICSEKGDV
ncbi:hypothetical protein QR680_018546 [Steinernema hermaphroditum]|uniref:Invertebrate defensins family profile domain-containing protein n=1 Tax=Steinernema hermaphroditum TaxID=289476 RepID=A0AA39HKM1_9BILA|nr:hypothetical protein QR680_018546 [Steinernema hermaphroditum]